jgi:glycosyltransferase involved in cell wall biosynthesis
MSTVHLWAGATFGKRVVRDGFGGAQAVYAFNTAALELLTIARERGLFTVLEQTIAPRALEETLLAEERARFPDWESQHQRGGAADETAKREVDEWALADMILCGSQFVQDGIARCGGPVERCVVVPYGVDASSPKPAPRPHSGPLRVLTVGQVCLRKGAPYALEAAEMLKGIAHLRWVGQVNLHTKAHDRLAKAIQLTGTVPRTEIVVHYDWADVFFLPSVCEGSAVVTYEALTWGLPVVTTTHAGSVVRDGVDGFIVSVGDTTAMAARLRQLHEDRTLLARLASGAIESARTVSFPAYRERLLRVLPGVGQ